MGGCHFPFIMVVEFLYVMITLFSLGIENEVIVMLKRPQTV